MQELEELVKSAKLDGFSRDEFVEAISRNPRFKGVKPEQIEAAWGAGVKKKDQSQPSSLGAKTASTASPLQSGLREQVTPSISDSERAAPSLYKATGKPSVSTEAVPTPAEPEFKLARPGKTPVQASDVTSVANAKEQDFLRQYGAIKSTAGDALSKKVVEIVNNAPKGKAREAIITKKGELDELYRQFSPDESSSMFSQDQAGNVDLDDTKIKQVLSFMDMKSVKDIAKLRDQEEFNKEAGDAWLNNSISRIGLNAIGTFLTVPDIVMNIPELAPYMAKGLAIELASGGNPYISGTLSAAFNKDSGYINKTELGEIGQALFNYSAELGMAERIDDFGEERAAKGITGNFSDGTLKGLGTGAAMLGSSFIDNLPQLALTVAAPEVALPFLGAMSASETYNRIVDDSSLSAGEKVTYALVMGGIEYASEKILNSDVSMLRKSIKDAGVDLGTKQGKKELGDAIFGWMPPAARSIIEEPIEEAIVAGVDQVMNNHLTGKAVDITEIAESALAGLGSGVGTTVLTRGVTSVLQSDKVQDTIKRTAAMKKLNSLIQDENISEEERSILKEELSELVKKDAKIRKDAAKFYDKFSQEDVDETVKLNATIMNGISSYANMQTQEGKDRVVSRVKDAMAKKKAIEAKYQENVSQEGKQVPGTEQGGETAIQAEPVEGAGKKETPAGRVLQAPEKAVSTVRGLLNRRATYSDPISGTIVEGDVYQDGQRVVVETEEGKIFDIGNIDEIQDRPTSELGLNEAKGRISVNEDGSFTYNGGDNQKIQGGTVMVNRQGGLKSIKKNKDGSIKSVAMTSPDGTETYNLKGQDAVDAAYQIMLNFSTSPEQSARVEQMLQQNEKARTEIESARVALEQTPETTTEEAAGDTVNDTVGGYGPRVGGVGKQATTQEIRTRTASDPQKGNLYNAVRRASKTLSSIIPDATYVFVDSDAEAAEYYKANMADVDAKESGSDKGRIFQNKNTGKVEIVINTSKADDVTAYHELFHAAFFRVYAQDAKTAIDFSNRLAKVLESGTAAEKAIAKRVKDHVSKYEGDADAVVSEEFLAELAGIMTSDAKSITQGMAAKLANFFNRIAKAMGIDPIFKEAATTKEVVDFMNSFAKAARQGGDISAFLNGPVEAFLSTRRDDAVDIKVKPSKQKDTQTLEEARDGLKKKLRKFFPTTSDDLLTPQEIRVYFMDDNFKYNRKFGKTYENVANILAHMAEQEDVYLFPSRSLPGGFLFGDFLNGSEALDMNVELAPNADGDVYIETVESFDTDGTNKGAGTRLMNRLIEAADFLGVKLALDAYPTKRFQYDENRGKEFTKKQLDGMADRLVTDFYSKFGFVSKSTDSKNKEEFRSMYREPAAMSEEVLTGTFRPSSSKSVGKVDPKAKRENLERSKNFPTQTVSSMDYDGETVLTTPSDRLAAGAYTLPSGEKVELKGGFGYPAQTGKVWAASKLSKATPLVGQINRQIKERGYALVAPIIMADASHKSNYTYFSVAMKLINQAADKKKLSNKDFLDQVKNAGKKAGVDLSDVNAKTVKENTDILLDKFSVESGAFERRKGFITELLGNTTPGGKNNVKLNGVVTSDQLAAMLADPILDGMPRGAIVSLIKVTKPVVARKTSIEEDGFLFHESYPAVIETEEGGIEMILIDDAQLAMEAIPVAETTNGKIVSLAARDGNKNDYATDLGLSNIPGVNKGTLRISDTDANKTEQDGKEAKRPAAGNRLFNEPLTAVKSIADKYFKGAFGTERPKFEGTRTLDEARAKRISDAFDAMKHSPNDPEVAAAYEALAKETVDQYNAFLDAGYTVEINNDEPYANSQEMIDDLRNNKRIKIFSTESGFGDTPITPKQRKENPLLATTKFKDVNGQPMLVNDLFRAVHDFYGHAELGNSFGAKGEENAWNVHARMFSPLARRAMTTETRGQNSYVNFSGVNEKIDKLREKARKLREEGKLDEALDVAGQIYELTSFADQKVGLLPEEFSQIDGLEARSSKFDDSKRSFSKAELDELPNSRYTKEQIESMINSGTYSLMSAENPQAAKTVEDNDERTARAEKWLKKNGYGNYTKIYGVFGNKENSFLVPDMTMEDAEAFRKEFDQESVAHSDGYIDKYGVNPRDREGNKFGIDYKNPKSNNYSIIKDSEGDVISFQTNYNFKERESFDIASRSSKASQDAYDIVDELATEGAVKPTTMQKVKDNTLRAFVLTPEQQLVRSYKETQQSMVGRAGKKIRVQAESLNKLLGKNDELRLAVTAYLSGDLASSYDIIDKSPKGEQIFDLLTDMRAFVDSMSSDLTTSPSFMALPDALKATIQANIGTYLRTSYRFWKDKNYNIDKAMRREAIAHQFDSNVAYELDKLLKEGMSPDDAEVKINSSRDEILRKAEKQIDEYIAEVERIRNAPEFKASGVVTAGQIKIPSDQLSGKKTVPDYIQQLLGVEKDPVVRFVDTAVALANIKYKGEMVYKIVTSLGADSIKTADQVTDGQIKNREFIKVNDKFSPLNDMYVHKDVFDVINNEDIYSSDISWIQGYFNILKLSRKSKVIYNSPTWRKNITGGWQIMLANGVINTSTITDLVNRAKFLAGKEDPEVAVLLDRMAEFGLIGTDVNANIIGNVDAIYASSLTGDTKFLDKASNYIKSVDAKVGEKYSAIDDYTKMIIFRNKRDNAAKKMFGKPFSELTEAEQYKSDAALAEEIKRTTPTFSRLPPAYKKLAKLPVGDFLSFKLEAARSISNVFITAVEDIKKSTDPKLSSVQRKAYAISGVSKLMGASTALSMAYVIPAMLSSMFLGDDEELYEDALKLRANWMDGHNLVVKKVYPDGRIAYYDLSMEDTYGDITNTIFQLSNGELESAIKSLAADVQPNMAVELLVSIFTGKNEYAGDLYESYDPVYMKALKLAGHSVKSTVAPPSAYSSGRDASKAVEDNPELNWTQEFLTRFVKRIAVRDYESNAGKQFYYIVKESSSGITKDEQYTKLEGDARENRFEALSDMREEYLALTKISQYYGNRELKRNAKDAVKRYLNKDEEAYVLRGKIR